MIIAFFLKTLCDISFYMCFAALIGSAFGVQPNLLPYVLLLSLCAAFSMAVDGKTKPPFLRFIPIAAGIAGIILTGDIATILVLVPPLLYIAYICWKRFFHPEYYHAVDSFKTLSVLLAVMVLVVLIFGGWRALQTYSGPFIVLYLLGSILLLRMLRHSEETMKQPAFLIMNAASIGGVCLLSVLMFSGVIIKIIKSVLLAIYSVTIVPFVYLVSPVVAGIGWIIAKLFFFLISHSPFKPPQQLDSADGDALQKQLEDRLTSGLPKELLYILYGVFIAALLFFIFKKLLDKHQCKEESVSSSACVHTPSRKRTPSFSSLFPNTPAGQVRFYYRKLLLFFIKQGLPLTSYMDTGEIERECYSFKPGEKVLIKKMHFLYRPARYGTSVQKQSAEEARKIYRTIKKASK